VRCIDPYGVRLIGERPEGRVEIANGEILRLQALRDLQGRLYTW